MGHLSVQQHIDFTVRVKSVNINPAPGRTPVRNRREALEKGT